MKLQEPHSLLGLICWPGGNLYLILASLCKLFVMGVSSIIEEGRLI